MSKKIPREVTSSQAIIYLAMVIRACKVADLEVKKYQHTIYSKSPEDILQDFLTSTELHFVE